MKKISTMQVFGNEIFKEQKLTIGLDLARKIHDFRSTKGLAMVQIRCLRGFDTKSEAFA